MRANTGINRGGNIKLTGEEKSSPLGETMQAYTIYKNITMAICAIGLIYYLICYLRAEDRVKAHYHQYRWRRWDEEPTDQPCFEDVDVYKDSDGNTKIILHF